MFGWLTKRFPRAATARELYGAVVTQARNPAFYRHLGVADTPSGRYELVALHLVLVLERLGAGQASHEALRRDLLEAFIEDMDGSMREMGIGVDAVPKRVQKAADGLYARASAYRAALAGPDGSSLEAALKTCLYWERDADEAPRMAAYVRSAAAALAREPLERLAAGHVEFASPEGAP
jgi:cytochrome b pre-mRNA-processing protein 3